MTHTKTQDRPFVIAWTVALLAIVLFTSATNAQSVNNLSDYDVREMAIEYLQNANANTDVVILNSPNNRSFVIDTGKWYQMYLAPRLGRQLNRTLAHEIAHIVQFENGHLTIHENHMANYRGTTYDLRTTPESMRPWERSASQMERRIMNPD